MKVLIIGSGAREHALAWKIKQSPLVEQVFVAPGNAGTDLEDKVQNINIKATALADLADFAKEAAIDLTLVGPEAPLALGLVDLFQSHGLACFGPSQYAAQLESSKAFSKSFMIRYDIPTARYAEFTHIDKALDYIDNHPYPLVIKADGLAAGKGVVVADNPSQAQTTIKDFLSGDSFGQAGHKIIIEEFLEGEEASFIVISDGKIAQAFASSQDHKALNEGDLGPNTGGMGAYSPAPIITPSLHKEVMKRVIEPTLAGMQAEGHPFVGFLYAGLMIRPDNQFKVLEFNVRFGDPEAQAVLFRLESDLVPLCQKALSGQLAQTKIIWDEKPALSVVLAATGYPKDYPSKQPIGALPKSSDACKVFHAGTTFANNELVTNGGRVLSLTAKAPSLLEAKTLAYGTMRKIKNLSLFHYRRDIGDKAIN